MKQIFLIMIGISILNAEITRESNGIVTDTNTKLQWQDDALGSAMDWEAAISYCESLPLGGHSDWRLPNINELKSIVDKSKYHPPIVDGFVHTDTRMEGYWSSTTPEDSKYDAYFIGFHYGFISRHNKDSNKYIRCVRDEQ